MYPTMSQQPQGEPRPSTSAELQADRLYPTMRRGEHRTDTVEALPGNHGMQLQAGLKTDPQPEHGDSSGESSSRTPPAAKPDAPVLTREVLRATLPEDLAQQIEQDTGVRNYRAMHEAAFAPTQDPSTQAVNAHVVDAAIHAGVSDADFTGMVQLARQFRDKGPSPEQYTMWQSLTSMEEKQAASTALSRNPVLKAVLQEMRITDAPQVVCALAKARR